MLNDPPTGCIPVVLYVCTAEDDLADLITTHMQSYAQARDWPVTEAVRDSDRRQPLRQRPGWARVLHLLSVGTARGIVTYSQSMIAIETPAFEVARRQITELGVFLAVARAAPAQPRSTASDAARRRDLSAAASGWHLNSPAC